MVGTVLMAESMSQGVQVLRPEGVQGLEPS